MKNEQNMADSQTKSSIAFIKIEDNEIPALRAGSEIYFAVKMVEGKVLRHFPNIIPENVPPLTVVPLCPKQIELLNNISIRRNMKFDPLVTGDSMVKVQDFINFYVSIKQRYPHCAEAMKKFAHKSVQDQHDQCGWLLINTSVVPYILHDDSQYLPLEVLKQSVNLDVPSKISNLLNENHCGMINMLCKSLNSFCTFAIDTKYVPLHFVLDFCDQIIVQKLDVPPGENPHRYAKKYIFDHTSSNTKELSAASLTSVPGSPLQTSCETELTKSSTETNLSSQALNQLNSSTSRKRSLSPDQTSVSKRQSTDPNISNGIRSTSLDSIVPISQISTSASTHVKSRANISMVEETEISTMQSTVQLVGNTTSLSVDSQGSEHISKQSIQKKVSTDDWSSQFKRIKITGKSILCLIRDDNQSYILVEPLARLFFPFIKLQDFVSKLEEIVPFLCVCTVVEESQFQQLYGIPVAHSLKCNKLIDIEALQKCLPLLFKTFQKPLKPHMNKLKDAFIEID